jgi:hypothetical protein
MAEKTFTTMTLKRFIKLSGFILIAAGTIGLLLNEFFWASSSGRTIVFAVVNLVGFASLAFAHFGLRKQD